MFIHKSSLNKHTYINTHTPTNVHRHTVIRMDDNYCKNLHKFLKKINKKSCRRIAQLIWMFCWTFLDMRGIRLGVALLLMSYSWLCIMYWSNIIIHIQTYTYTQMPIYIYLYTHIHIYIYIYIYIYRHYKYTASALGCPDVKAIRANKKKDRQPRSSVCDFTNNLNTQKLMNIKCEHERRKCRLL